MRKMRKTSDQMSGNHLKVRDESVLDIMLKVHHKVYHSFFEPQQFQEKMCQVMLQSLSKTVLREQYPIYAKKMMKKLGWKKKDPSRLVIGETARKMGKTTLLALIISVILMIIPMAEVILFAQVIEIAKISLDIIEFLYFKEDKSDWVKRTQHKIIVTPPNRKDAMDCRMIQVRASTVQISLFPTIFSVVRQSFFLFCV